MTSGGVLVREILPWELMRVPRTECWSLGVVSFAVVTVSAVVVHNTLWGIDVVENEMEGGACYAHRTRCSARHLLPEP